MVPIIKSYVPEEKYGIKCPYTMTPTRVVVHNTANDASARNEVSYMTSNNLETSFHYAVDDREIVQGIPEYRNAWHAGDGGQGVGNRQGIAVEICYSKSGGDRFDAAEENAAQLIASILKRYGWGIDRVTKHQDYMNKYCPHRTLDYGWERFLRKVETAMQEKLSYDDTVNQMLEDGVTTRENMVNWELKLSGQSPIQPEEARAIFDRYHRLVEAK